MQEAWVRSLGQEDPRRREWLPTPAFSLGNPLERQAWWAMVCGVAKELDTTEQLRPSLSFSRSDTLKYLYIYNMDPELIPL